MPVEAREGSVLCAFALYKEGTLFDAKFLQVSGMRIHRATHYFVAYFDARVDAALLCSRGPPSFIPFFLFSFLFSFFFFYIYLVYFIFYCIRTLSTRIIVLRVLFFSLLCYIFSLELFLSLLSLSTPLFFNYYHYYYYHLIFIRITHFFLFFFLGGRGTLRNFIFLFLSSLFSFT